MPTTQEIRDHLTSLANSYGVPTALVLAVARTETANFDVNAVVPNLNTSGELLSTDYGLMQINDKTWIGNTLPGQMASPSRLRIQSRTTGQPMPMPELRS